ncbi:cell division protein FtsQ/DivIB [Nocardioides acrostichi]|uniref:FtsQ-type POTRA domain-containing protein n=1 Tax=Nocardioides acrostichi TaxID=2784339 RepID=A0A930Y671_9ACTN|nr:FtsQ-type POTRA domain-containing protein [Nocardioides acrostichi]MBF4160626.1 FtsQ-type POTRA domain-containing protein [Nocardioides acrostichi]
MSSSTATRERPRATPEERTRRAFARRRWARRWLGWRKVLVALLVAGLLVLGAYALWFSPWLAADEVEVDGLSQLTEQQVLASADVPLGTPLARLDVDAIATRVRSLVGVESADVTRSWPHGVSIDVTERQAVAIIAMDGRLRGIDADGVVYRDYKTAPPELPTLLAPSGITSDALREGAGVVAALPDDLLARVDHVSVRSVDEISLALRDGRTVEWGSDENSAQKAEVLSVLLDQQAQVYDVSVPSRPTTR